jgi:hypothetical protein
MAEQIVIVAGLLILSIVSDADLPAEKEMQDP